MKPLIGLFLVAFSILPAAATAQTIGVRSGDHPGFTRIVIDLDGQEDWVFGRVEGGFEFRPESADLRYRLDRVYDKIGRTRIADIRDLGDGRLHLDVSCACHGVVDVLSDGRVVLDIVTGPAPAPGTGVDALLPPFGGLPESPAVMPADAPVQPLPADDPQPIIAAVGNRAGLPLTFSQAERGVTARPPDPAPVGPSIAAHATGTEDEPVRDMATDVAEEPHAASAVDDDPDRAARIARTEAALLEQVARAAAQGLLDADMSEIEENVAETRPEPVDAPEPAPIPPPAPDPGHIRVETSVDRAGSGKDRHGKETDEGTACIDPAVFDIGTWGGEIGNGTDIAAYRSQLVTELDVADGASVSALVRNYIYITFGAEAKALIHRYPDAVERPDLLLAMAEIMDEGQSTDAAYLAGQMGCEGATALWAALAQPELRPGQTINRNAVSMAFGALPAHLRRHLGPKLADRLRASGDLDTADLIRAAIGRVNVVPSSEYEMVTAQFELDAGQVEHATEILDDVVASADATLPEALLRRVEATLGADGAVAEDVVVLLDSLAFQYRGSDTARQMVDAGIRARASAGDFNAAFEQLEAAVAAGLFTPERHAQLQAGLFDRVTRDSDDTAFLRLALPRLDTVAGLALPSRRALAGRLLALGLADPARRALGRDSTMPDADDRQLLARAALVENRPAAAIGYLAGLADPTAQALRARALDMARDYAGALGVYAETGDHEGMVRMAWRGGLWSEVAELDPGSRGAAAQLMAGTPAPSRNDIPPGLDPDEAAGAAPSGVAGGETAGRDATRTQRTGQTALAEAQALIGESETARQVLAALLEEVAAPAETALDEAVPGF